MSHHHLPAPASTAAIVDEIPRVPMVLDPAAAMRGVAPGLATR